VSPEELARIVRRSIDGWRVSSDSRPTLDQYITDRLLAAMEGHAVIDGQVVKLERPTDPWGCVPSLSPDYAESHGDPTAFMREDDTPEDFIALYRVGG
jgi:hypothetical protein